MAILDRNGVYATGCNLWLHAPDFSGATIPDISDSGVANDALCTGSGVVGGVLRTETFDGQTVARSNGDMTATVTSDASFNFADGENFTIYMLYNHQESHFDWDFWFTKGFFPGVEVRVSGWNTNFEFSVGDSFGNIDGTRIRNTAGLVAVFCVVDQVNEEVKIYEGGGNDTTDLIGSFTYTQGSSSDSGVDLEIMNDQGLAGSIHRFRDWAVWNNRILTEQEMNDLAADPDAAFATGGGGTTLDISATSAMVSSITGAVKKESAVSATAAVVFSISGSAVKTATVSGEIGAASQASAALSAISSLQSSFSNTLSVSGSLSAAKNVSGVIASGFSISALLEMAANFVELSSTIGATSGVSGNISAEKTLQAESSSLLTLSANSLVTISVSGDVLTVSGGQAALSVAKQLAAGSLSQFGISANLTIFDPDAKKLENIDITSHQIYRFKITPAKTFNTNIESKKHINIKME